MRKLLCLCGLLATTPVFAEDVSLNDAITNARNQCSGIGGELSELKKMAGINTAVTGVGTLAGGGALVTGLIKSGVDKDLSELKAKLEKYKPQQEVVGRFVPDIEQQIQNIKFDAESDAGMSELEQKSKTLGNWRTGLMAGSAATNIAGAVIAGGNKVGGDLSTQIAACRDAVAALANARAQARLDGAEEAQLNFAQNIITECGKWDSVDLSKINKRANNAMVSSIVGATAGIAGMITSASANSESVRAGSEDKEKGLNVASNVLAAGTTGASLGATIFNASQISAVKKASDVADKCEEVLK